MSYIRRGSVQVKCIVLHFFPREWADYVSEAPTQPEQKPVFQQRCSVSRNESRAEGKRWRSMKTRHTQPRDRVLSSLFLFLITVFLHVSGLWVYGLVSYPYYRWQCLFQNYSIYCACVFSVSIHDVSLEWKDFPQNWASPGRCSLEDHIYQIPKPASYL